METLPYLALEKIVQQLSPVHLARCSAVCRGWRETFNQDWIWEPHCDPELEEPLRTIPSVATPVFVTPEGKDSTLSPICHWRLAFMRENHLWNNWKRKNIEEDSENSVELTNAKSDILDGHFLADTLIVVWHYDYIEILDFSEKSWVCRAKTDVKYIDPADDVFYVISGTILVIERNRSVEVYSVDLINNQISLKHCIYLAEYSKTPLQYISCSVKKNFYFFGDDQRLMFTVFDLNTGEVLKEEPYPLMPNIYETIEVFMIHSSETSEFIAVVFEVKLRNVSGKRYPVFAYSIEHHTFLQDLEIEDHDEGHSRIVLHRHFLAFIYNKLITVHNLRTKEVPLCRKDLGEMCKLEVWNDCFVFLEVKRLLNETHLIKYSPEENTWTIMFKWSPVKTPFNSTLVNVVDQKAFVVNCNSSESEYLWKLSGKKVLVMECKHRSLTKEDYESNQSFTKILLFKDRILGEGEIQVYHLW